MRKKGKKGGKGGLGPQTEKKQKVSARKYDALLKEYNQLLENNTGVQLMLAALISKHGLLVEGGEGSLLEYFLNIDDFRLVAGARLATETVTIDEKPQTRLVVQLTKPVEVLG